MSLETTVDQLPDLLIDYFGNKLNAGNIDWFVIGYKIENGISVPHVYLVDISDKATIRKNFEDATIDNGAVWDGESEILARLFRPVKIQGLDDEWIDVGHIPVSWNYMTLQDAIDFANYAIRATIDTIRFQQTEKTVGGPR